jgi:hypothetical protein
LDELPHESSPSKHNSHHGSPHLDDEDEDEDGVGDGDGDDNDEAEDGGGRLLKTPTPASSTVSLATRGTKRKSMADSIAEVSAHERVNRIKIANINAAAKNLRSDQRESRKRSAQMAVELARFQHQRDEAAAQRAHEAVMFDKQVALELARTGHGGGAQASYGVGGPLDHVHPALR